MFLSNPRKTFLLALFSLTLFQACGSSPGNENKPVSLTIETKSESPFSTREPEIYQGDFVVTSGNIEDKWFVARKGGKLRFDYFSNDERSNTQLRTDKSYSIDHNRKIYAAIPEDKTSATESNTDTTSNFFRGIEYREFEDLGTEGNLRKYKIREGASAKNEILIYIDEPSGMMVRQEFLFPEGEVENGSSVKFIYEIRNLKLEVDDSIFTIPEGYRKVSPDEYRTSFKKNR